MKSLIISIFFFLSLTSLAQIRSNSPFVFNVQVFGAKGDGVTNDRDAIQAATNAAFVNHSGKVYFPYTGKAYNVSGTLITSLDGVNPNCLIYFPLNHDSTISITFEGEIPPPFLNETAGSSTSGIKGVVIYSPIQGTGTTPAIFGSSWYSAGVTGNRNYTEGYFNNIEVRTNTKGATNNDTLGTMSGINASKLLTFSYENLQVTTTSSISNSVQPTNNTYGLIMPDVNNHSKLDLVDGIFQGYKYGVQLTEHCHFTHLTVVGCVNALKNIDGYHTITIDHFTGEANINNISLEGTCPISIFDYETEHVPSSVGKWYTFATDINQVSGTSRVQIFNAGVVKSAVGVVDSFTVAGSPNYVVYNGQGSFPTGYIPFGDRTNYRLNSDATFFWDNTNKRLGLGTASPSERLHLYSSGNSGAYIETSASGNEAYLHFRSGGVGIANLETFGSTFANGAFQNALTFTSLVNNSGTINFLTTTSGSAVSRFKIDNTGMPTVTAAAGYLAKWTDGTRDMRLFSGTGYVGIGMSSASTDVRLFVNDDVGAAHVAVLQNSTGNFGIGILSPSYKLDVTGTVHSTGKYTFDATNTATGTTGAQTINKPSGKVNFAAAATTLVVTNSLVATSSIVILTVEGTDATATSARVTLASGSFTITLNAAATAETKVAFLVIN